MRSPAAVPAAWRCPVCDGARGRAAWRVPPGRIEDGVSAEAFRPSSGRFGQTAAMVIRCETCGHGSLAEAPPAEALREAYADAADPVSVREEAGQVRTAHDGLALLERVVRPGRLLDVGCWTGSFPLAAGQRGWEAVGVEPSRWASERARSRGVDARTQAFEEADLEPASFRAVAMSDVIEHLAEPGEALDRAAGLLEPGGALFLTTPDAGSRVARALGRRWWSVLPMHVQYFTRGSLERLLRRHGFVPRIVRTHPKTFSARYYAERVAGYAPALARAGVTVLDRAGAADRQVSPDFRDRMAMVAVLG